MWFHIPLIFQKDYFKDCIYSVKIFWVFILFPFFDMESSNQQLYKLMSISVSQKWNYWVIFFRGLWHIMKLASRKLHKYPLLTGWNLDTEWIQIIGVFCYMNYHNKNLGISKPFLHIYFQKFRITRWMQFYILSLLSQLCSKMTITVTADFY